MDGGIFDPATITKMFAEFEQNLVQPEYWLSVLKIIWIDILLSGDNALVIALACRNLPDQQRKWGMILGAGAAVSLRVVFATVIVVLMTIPYLKLVGGLALLVIAAKLLVPDPEDEDVDAASNLLQAVWLIVLADVVMSLDNVIAIAAAADGSVSLLIFGLIVSIPLIIAGAALIVAILDRLPVLVWAGAALLGWIAGHVIATDIAVEPFLHRVLKGQLTVTLDASSALLGFAGKSVGSTDLGGLVMSLIGVIVVLIAGGIWRRNKLRQLAALKTI